jgi:hypothetical protein
VRKLCRNLFGFDGVFCALVQSSAEALSKFYEFLQRADSRVPQVYRDSGLSDNHDITSEWVIYQS